MTDRNGVEIKIGMKAVAIGGGLNRKLGYVRSIRTGEPSGNQFARVTDVRKGLPGWSAWLTSEQLEVVP